MSAGVAIRRRAAVPPDDGARLEDRRRIAATHALASGGEYPAAQAVRRVNRIRPHSGSAQRRHQGVQVPAILHRRPSVAPRIAEELLVLPDGIANVDLAHIEQDVARQHVREVMRDDAVKDDVRELVRLAVPECGVKNDLPPLAVDALRIDDVVVDG
jgi:hypothetical protein